MRNTTRWLTFCLLGVISLSAFAQAFRILDEAPMDHAVDLPRERLVAFYRQMASEGIGTLRLLEGGEYNVNIRHLEDVTPDNFTTLVHADTIDVWVVQEGSGTVVTGGRKDGDRQVGGDERFISVGDVIFVPAGVPHGMKETSAITFLNIRFPEHRN